VFILEATLAIAVDVRPAPIKIAPSLSPEKLPGLPAAFLANIYIFNELNDVDDFDDELNGVVLPFRYKSVVVAPVLEAIHRPCVLALATGSAPADEFNE